jgi:hypothetical protein
MRKGLEFWHTGDHGAYLRTGTLPLAMDIDTFPVFLREKFQGHPTSYLSGNDPRALLWARITSLIWWWLLLFYAMRVANLLAGNFAARAVLALLAFEPVLLGNVLVMADIAVCGCLLAFLYHYRVGRGGPWQRRVGIPAAWLAVAILAKISAIFFFMPCVLVIELGLRAQNDSSKESARRDLKSFLRDIAQIAVIGLFVAILYSGCSFKPSAGAMRIANHLYSYPALRIFCPLAAWIARAPIFPNAVTAILYQLKMNSVGRGVYIFGRSMPHSVWYYFPVAISMKLTIPLLLIPVLILVLSPRSLLNWACGGALLLFLINFSNRTQIGVRLILPIVTLAIVGLAAALGTARQSTKTGWQRNLWTVAPVIVLCWAAFSAIRAWPDAAIYFNEAWGGSDKGYLLLSDSNYDMGQGLPDFAQWLRQNNSPGVDVLFFGRDPSIHTMPVRQILPDSVPAAIPQMQAGRYLAISATYLYGNDDDVRDNPQISSLVFLLHSQHPIARTPTFFIYDETPIASGMTTSESAETRENSP